MAKLCHKCGFPLDPWGDCIRCVRDDNVRDCERIRVAVRRDLQTMEPSQVAHRYRDMYPALTVDVVASIGKRVKRRQRKAT